MQSTADDNVKKWLAKMNLEVNINMNCPVSYRHSLTLFPRSHTLTVLIQRLPKPPFLQTVGLPVQLTDPEGFDHSGG